MRSDLSSSRSTPTLPARDRWRFRALAAAIGVAALLVGASPALAGHDDVYCEVHRAHYRPTHFARHADGYLVHATAGYRFYPAPGYARLEAAYPGRPAVFVSGGYFYPLQVGYGPLYEPVGYFAIHGARFGGTRLGLQIGIHALPTVGFGFLSYRAPVVYYHPRPYAVHHWTPAAPPHVRLYARNHRGHAHGRHHSSPKWRAARFD